MEETTPESCSQTTQTLCCQNPSRPAQKLLLFHRASPAFLIKSIKSTGPVMDADRLAATKAAPFYSQTFNDGFHQKVLLPPTVSPWLVSGLKHDTCGAAGELTGI